MRSKSLWRVHVSIRDMDRALRLYKVLMRGEMRYVFLLPPPENASPEDVSRQNCSDCSGRTASFNNNTCISLLQALRFAHWLAIIMAVSLAYQLRLPAHLRVEYAERIDCILRENLCPPELNVQSVVNACMNRLYDGTFVPKGIAPTR